MTTLALDVDNLLGELADPPSAAFDGLPPGTIMGHVHLKVAGIEETVAFYRDVLGLALMAELGPHAAFLSAGGYHHHISATPGRAPGPRRPRPAPRRYSTRRSFCRTRLSVSAYSNERGAAG